MIMKIVAIFVLGTLAGCSSIGSTGTGQASVPINPTTSETSLAANDASFLPRPEPRPGTTYASKDIVVAHPPSWNPDDGATPNVVYDRTPDNSTSTDYCRNSNYYGAISCVNGLPRTHLVSGYYRRDGTYVRPYWRSK